MDKFLRTRTSILLGFTLVELLIAMTITLLLMAGLARAFGVIGESIKEGRSQVTLSSKLRNLSFRLRTDLRSRTADATPPIKTQSRKGYFMYYEGPLTDQTFGLYGDAPTQQMRDGTVVSFGDAQFNNFNNSATYRRYGAIGDFDDYVAFTAEAPGDDWFTGKVPAYLVDDAAADPMQPVVIRSKFAEIVMWASPKWNVDPVSNLLQYDQTASAMPLYLDGDNNLVPDQIVLHQRILLIRPDLNVARRIPNAVAAEQFEGNVLRPFLNDPNPARVPPALERIYPIGQVNPIPAANPAPAPLFPNYVHPTSDTNNQFMLESNWLVGMAPLHHFYDISLRRIVNPRTGEPTGYVAANSLEDLTQPHNRFGHVRYPGRYMGRGDFSQTDASADLATSMPLLAVGWNDAILNWQGVNDPRSPTPTATPPAWFPASHPSPRTLNAAANSRCGLFNGWLLPQFELGDPNQPGWQPSDQWQRGYLAVANADPRWDRTGEDVVASDILAFDVQGFDSEAPIFITSGPDGEPGAAGADDDNLGGIDTTVTTTAFDPAGQPLTELGTYNTDDEVVGVGDMTIYSLMSLPNAVGPGGDILNPRDASTFGANRQMLSSRGAFVDLMYPFLAGSSLRDLTLMTGASVPIRAPLPAINTNVQQNYADYLQSELSLYRAGALASSMQHSGKLLRNGLAGDIFYFQPTYDSWTDLYESDGFDQTLTADAAAVGPSVGTTWVLNNPTSLSATPRMPATASALQIDSGRFDPTAPETTPPIAVDMKAIQMTIRITDHESGEMSQFSVIESLQ